MDYKKIVTAVFMNLGMLFILLLAVHNGIKHFREKRKPQENKKKIPLGPEGIFSPRETDFILLFACIYIFYKFTFPFIQDIPYLAEQNYEEASGTIIQCNANGILAEITYRNNVTGNIEIEGDYGLAGGEEIVVRYLPHADVRMEWYVLDDVTGEPVYLETGSSSLIDNRAFMLVMALGCPMAVKFITLIFLKKLEEEEKKDRMRHLKMLKYAENIAMVIGALFMLRFISLNL